ncbi:MAG: hypothetical protein LBK95_12175 [Bifidobacteriaceae bacterium]|jgi:predicted nucleic acid-binding protein|nr:hypothetical protein [Bifidobacteriaceae bacterium]
MVTLPPDAVAPVFVATVRARHGVRLPDAYALAAAIALKAPLAAFDKRLRPTAGAAAVTLVPAAV